MARLGGHSLILASPLWRGACSGSDHRRNTLTRKIKELGID
jgi:hypothetical protein